MRTDHTAADAVERESASTIDRPAWTRTQRALGWVVVGLGTLLRLRAYIADRSLWRDEAMFVFNLTHRDLTGFTRPLDFAQGVQPGFYVLEHLAGSLGGQTSYAYRFLPLAASVLTLVLGVVLVRRELTPITGLVALTLLATSTGLIYFAAEVKPYGIDVCTTVAVLLAASVARERGYDRRSCLVLATLGTIGLLLSFAATFVLAGVGLAMAWSTYRAEHLGAVKRLVAVGAAWAVVWGLLYALVGRHVADNSFFKETLPDAFLAIPPTNGVEVDRWRIVVSTYFEQLSRPGVIWLLGPVAVLGIVVLLRQRRGLVALLVLPWVFAVLASTVELYPVAERHMLWILPALAVFIGAGTEAIAAWVRARSAPLAIVPIVVVLVVAAAPSFERFVSPPPLEEMDPVVAFIEAHQQPGDVVYVSEIAETAYDFYAAEHGVELPVTAGRTSVYDADAVAAQIEGLAGSPRVWVVTAAWWRDPGDLAPGVTEAFDRLGSPVDRYVAPGAEAYLYDLSSS